jgi:dTDP-4-dehydrorhamnose 3,5-epimerase-like enzyme
MAELIHLPQFTDERGVLTVLENVFSKGFKRIYFIKQADGKIRGHHSHIKTSQLLTCIQGSVRVLVKRENDVMEFLLDSDDKCLLLNPEDWHEMIDFQDNAILLVASNELFDPKDYVF